MCVCSFIHEGKAERGIKVALTKKQLDSSADATEMKLQPFDRECVCVRALAGVSVIVCITSASVWM